MHFSVIGYPIKHSLSPLIHEANFKANNDESSYVKSEVHPDDLKNIRQYMIQDTLSGINVTVPHKEKIMDFLDVLDPTAKEIGAVNTVSLKDDILTGYNTDVTGYIKAFNDSFGPLKNRHILILGAGGAAKAVHRAHVDHGDKVTIVARRLESFNSFIKKDFTSVLSNDFTGGHFDAVINATPLGLNNEDVFISMGINPDFIDSDTIGMDLIYNPSITPFMTYFKRSQNGLGMLINQAMDAYYIWTGKKGNTRAVETALKKYLEVE